nr:immunoglobulin heavy chain junction region [Macaca mulatta]
CVGDHRGSGLDHW